MKTPIELMSLEELRGCARFCVFLQEKVSALLERAQQECGARLWGSIFGRTGYISATQGDFIRETPSSCASGGTEVGAAVGETVAHEMSDLGQTCAEESGAVGKGEQGRVGLLPIRIENRPRLLFRKDFTETKGIPHLFEVVLSRYDNPAKAGAVTLDLIIEGAAVGLENPVGFLEIIDECLDFVRSELWQADFGEEQISHDESPAAGEGATSSLGEARAGVESRPLLPEVAPPAAAPSAEAEPTIT